MHKIRHADVKGVKVQHFELVASLASCHRLDVLAQIQKRVFNMNDLRTQSVDEIPAQVSDRCSDDHRYFVTRSNITMERKAVLILLPFIFCHAFATNTDKNALAKSNGQFLDNVFPPMANGNPLDVFVKAATDGVKGFVDGTNSLIGQVETGLLEGTKFNETFNQIVDTLDTGITDPVKQILETFNVPKELVDTITKAKDQFVGDVKSIVEDLITFLEDLLKQALEGVRSVIGINKNLLPDVSNDITKALSTGLPNFQTLTCAQSFIPKLLEAARPSGTHLSNCAIFHGAEMQKTFDMLKVAFSFVTNMEASGVVSKLDKCHKNETDTTDPATCADNVKTDFANASNQLNKTANYIKDSSPIQIGADLANLQHCVDSVVTLVKDAGELLKKEFFDCMRQK